jgi:hypothetical protein
MFALVSWVKPTTSRPLVPKYVVYSLRTSGHSRFDQHFTSTPFFSRKTSSLPARLRRGSKRLTDVRPPRVGSVRFARIRHWISSWASEKYVSTRGRERFSSRMACSRSPPSVRSSAREVRSRFLHPRSSSL